VDQGEVTAYSPVPCRKSLVPSRGFETPEHSAIDPAGRRATGLAVSSLSRSQGAMGKGFAKAG